jgi:hypothetical protein
MRRRSSYFMAFRLQVIHARREGRVACIADGYSLGIHYLGRPGAGEVQLDLLLDYSSNVALYPGFQAYLRRHRPPLLA